MKEQKRPKALHIILWVVQGLLAFAFAMAGFAKVGTPISQLAEDGMSFVNHFPAGVVKFIGTSEMLAAIGLILPAALRIKPVLTPLAALGIAVVMISATTYHITHGEPFMHTAILLLLALFVAWGRYKKAPILPK